MTIADIDNPKVRQIVKFALAKNGFKVTVVRESSDKVGFRIRKEDFSGWNVLEEIMFKSRLFERGPLDVSKGDVSFTASENSLIVWN